MVSHLHKDIITNAIRVLRARRVRPSLKKIAWLVQREHSLSEKSLLTLIEALVESKDILRVHFKGAISYRIPPNSLGSLIGEEDSYEENSSFENGFKGIGRAALGVVDHRNIHDDLILSSDSENEEHSLQQVHQQSFNDSSMMRSSFYSTSIHGIFKGRRGGRGGGIYRGSGIYRGGRGGGNDNMRYSNAGVGLTHHSSSLSLSGSAPKPRLHAGPQVRPPEATSINETISRVILSKNNNNFSVSTSSGGTNGSTTPKSGRSTPTMIGGNSCAVGGSDGDSNEVQCLEFETPCAPPRPPPVRGMARRGRPPLSSLGLDSRKPRPPSARPKCPLPVLTQVFPVQRAKRVYDPSGSDSLVPSGSSGTQLQYLQSSSISCVAGTGLLPTAGGTNRGSNGSKRRSGPDVLGEGASQINGYSGTCDLCQSGSDGGVLLRCCACPAAGHPSCLGYSAELAERSLRRPWTCMDCKHCAICDMDHLVGTLIFCDECDRAYHLTCHRPALTTQPHGTWVCGWCHQHRNGMYDPYSFSPYTSLGGGSSGGGLPLTPRDSPLSGGGGDDESRGSWPGAPVGSYDPSIPNATHWTVHEVAEHFEERGFEEEAKALKEQAVDGSAVLLMSRQDVLTGLGLKLGPALKLYRQVRVLQTRVSDPPLLC